MALNSGVAFRQNHGRKNVLLQKGQTGVHVPAWFELSHSLISTPWTHTARASANVRRCRYALKLRNSFSITLWLFRRLHIALKAPAINDFSVKAPIRSNAEARQFPAS